MERAHRVAWVLAGNEITPEKPHILHDCPDADLPACCNDRHLRDGTNAENMRDRARKESGVKSKKGLPFGVYPRRQGRFGAKIKIAGKTVHLGTYDTAQAAHEAAASAKRQRLAAAGPELNQGDEP